MVLLDTDTDFIDDDIVWYANCNVCGMQKAWLWLVCYGMVWYAKTWYAMVCYGMLWYAMV